MRPPRTWKENELQDVLTRISHGESVQKIAHYYHTSDDALYTMLSYRGYSVRSLRTSGAIQSHTLHGLAPLLGVCESTMYLWYRRGWLKAQRTRAGKMRRSAKPNGHYIVTDEALEDFLSDPIYSVLINPDGITDPIWREVVEDARSIHRLHTMDEAAEKMQVTRHTIGSWCYRGILSHIQLGRRRYISQEALDNFDASQHDRRGRRAA
jgi:excisionase family DNA binding protein